MTLVQLNNFIRIAELGSLSKAAAVIRIAQPALSRQVRQLELELGNPLLVRHAWGVSLTPAGELLLARARRLAFEVDSTRDAVQALAAEPTGRVAIAVPSSLAVCLLPPLAAVIARRYPLLTPHFIDGFSAAVHARALAGDLDLAVLYEDRAMGPLETTPLLSECLVLVGSADKAATGQAFGDILASVPLIVPARPNRLRLIVDDVLVQLPNADVRITNVDSLPAIIRMVELGSGWTVLPFSAVAEEVAQHRLQVWPLEPAALQRTLVLARPMGRKPTPAAVAVEIEIRDLVDQLAKPMRWRPLSATV